jgi:hypothetical protein
VKLPNQPMASPKDEDDEEDDVRRIAVAQFEAIDQTSDNQRLPSG